MQKKFNILVGFIAVISGLVAIFKLVPDIELAIGFITISFGILGIIWTSMAVKSLSKGSALRNYTTNFLFCLIFILLFTIWNTTSVIFDWRSANKAMLYPGYIFITIAFLTFVWTSYHILLLGKEFGFGEESSRINRRMGQKKTPKNKNSLPK